MKEPELRFHQGTLLLENVADDIAKDCGFIWDERTLQWRSLASSYRDTISYFFENKLSLVDQARDYDQVSIAIRKELSPLKHQIESLDAWKQNARRGIVSLPTGSGKSILGLLAICETKRSSLIVVPTIDLMLQWAGMLSDFLGEEHIGTVGGGMRNHRPITVTTYDSALIDVEYHGNKYGLLIFDECHHLPSPRFKSIVEGSIAPFKLGLTATLERSDGGESVLFDLIGPKVFEKQITSMVSTVLAPYDVVSIEVEMSQDEQSTYEHSRKEYLDFIKRHRVDFSRPDGWSTFIRLSSCRPGGPEAMSAYRRQRKVAQTSISKMTEIWKIIRRHEEGLIIIFTDENEHAYAIGRELVAPVLTHLTKAAERKRMLIAFREKRIGILVTSKVLNEGVDVPAANIAVVVSGSGTVREHVQRLGRILRNRPGKRAIMYEIVSKGTNEVFVNKRRRQHHAYQATP